MNRYLYRGNIEVSLSATRHLVEVHGEEGEHDASEAHHAELEDPLVVAIKKPLLHLARLQKRELQRSRWDSSNPRCFLELIVTKSNQNCFQVPRERSW